MPCYCGTCPQTQDEVYWYTKAQEVAVIHQQQQYQAGRGPCVIFILDTSTSIRGQGFRELKQAFTSIIYESSQHPDIDENIAVIVCGQRTQFHRLYSNRYNEIMHCIDEIECKGTSPLAAGMWLSIGALADGGGYIDSVEEFQVMPRIVLISDGRPTDIRLIGRENDSPEYETNSAKDQLLHAGSCAGRDCPIFCIPIGTNPDVNILEMLSARSKGGRVVHFQEVRQFGRYSQNLRIAASISRYFPKNQAIQTELIPSVLSLDSYSDLEDGDINDIIDFVKKRDSFVHKPTTRYHVVRQVQSLNDGNSDDETYQELNHHIPPLGTTGLRGPSRNWKKRDGEEIETLDEHSAEEGITYTQQVTYKSECKCGTCPQTDKEKDWLTKAVSETTIHQQLQHQAGKGPCVIFILDTSASITGQGFRELKWAFTSIIDEYSQYPDIDENVAVIICGQRTKFQRYYSNKYNDIIHCIDDIECEGSSPLAAGLWLSLGAMKNGGGRSKVLSNFHVMPRIVLISDGRPTDIHLIGRGDDSPEYETNSAKDQALRAASRLGKQSPVFCIPVGEDPDMTYLGLLTSMSNGGRIVHIHEVRQFGRYSRNVEIAGTISPFIAMNTKLDKRMILSVLSQGGSDKSSHLEDSDKNDIVDFVQRRDSFLYQGQSLKSEYGDKDDMYQELYRHMPPLGSRVKRGPSWKWQNQDSEGIGTVVGHLTEEDGWLSVEWDNGQTANYRFGKTIYDVVVCDEPRIPNNSAALAVGCRVKRGPDWEWADQDGGPANIGSVYRVKLDGTVYVRWPNSVRSNYRFGYKGKFDICPL
ncbi:uncharacterized protein LOC125649345 isoform X2 [Ostrea edulis]|uniref:uncharacterized protein LOC125649345 isoform X2 n=1 Tax=Ostrea edulis TaxID=37623 RepID=UPI0024AF2C83|nr:uncharacterized protein LOC125649345 isoform X2 [Ostrea edulis]